MATTAPQIPILATKLYRPPVAADYLPREALEARLESGIQLPLTLVCAPPGYGKSTLVSRCLASSRLPVAWLSLDKPDSDLRNFLSYFVASVRTLAAEACQQTLKILKAERLAALSVIHIGLSNDIEALEGRIVLVLDDLQRVSNPDIHLLLDSLLEHPLRNLHLVIITRRDPLLSLPSLRAHHLLNEFRMADLKFSLKESTRFLEKVSNRAIAASTVDKLQTKIEGWPTGLRLAGMAIQNQEEIDLFLGQFGTDTRPLQEYLISEVLSSLSPGMREQLIYTAILGRFTAGLCEAVWDADLTATEDGIGGREFINNLQSAEIFSISLDAGQEWYRFHHLFQDLLLRQLQETLGPEKVEQLHRRASRWFLEQGHIEEAVQHALQTGDSGLATEIIGQSRHQLMNTDQWHRLEAWLHLFPAEVVQQQAPLLLLRCWVDLSLLYRLDLFAEQVERAATLLEYSTPNTPQLLAMTAELKSLQSVIACGNCELGRSGTLAAESLRDSPMDQECVRSYAHWIQIMVYQEVGENQRAERLVWDVLGGSELRTPSGRARIWMAAAFNAWAEADTRKLREAAEQLHKIATEYDLTWSLSYARYFLGLSHYDNNDLPEAIAQFEIVANSVDHHNFGKVVDCSILLSLSFQALGQEEQARKALEQISNQVLEQTATSFLGLARALRAEIDIRQGFMTAANQWLTVYEKPPTHSMQRFYQSEIVATKVLLAQNTAKSRSAAGELLDSLHDFVTKIFHRRLLIDVLALKSVLAYHSADKPAAIALLGEALELGKPGRLISPFMNLGPEVTALLNRLDLDAEGMEYVGAIFAATQTVDDKTSLTNSATVELLSQRELEILQFLSQELTNKAIAEKLFISPGTVKRHAHNIFGKLAVDGRRAAVAKATGLGILTK